MRGRVTRDHSVFLYILFRLYCPYLASILQSLLTCIKRLREEGGVVIIFEMTLVILCTPVYSSYREYE